MVNHIDDNENGISQDKEANGIFFPDAPEEKPKAVSNKPEPTNEQQDHDQKSLVEQLKYQILADGSVQYKSPADQLYFTDHGRYIELDKSVEMDREAIIAMLKLAQEKFGGNIELTGTAEFKEQAIRIMLEEGMKIKLKHPEQYALKEQLQRELELAKSTSQESSTEVPKNGLVDANDIPVLKQEGSTEPPVSHAVEVVPAIEPEQVKPIPAKMQEDEIMIGQFAYSRAHEIEEVVYDGPFNAQHIKDVHQHLFQDTDTYEPGVIRSEAETWVARRKLPSTQDAYLVHYAPSSQIDTRLNDVLGSFDIEQLKGMDRQDAAKALAKLYADLDYIHPFQEGNSRTIRIVTQQIAQQAGLTIDWSQSNQHAESRDALYRARDSQVLRRAFDNGAIQSEMDLKAASRTLHKLQAEPSLEQIMSQMVIPTAELILRQQQQQKEPKPEQYDSGYKDKSTEIDHGMMEHMADKELKKVTAVERPVATLIIAPPGEYRDQLKERVANELNNNVVYANHAAFKDSPYYPVVKEHPAAWAKALATGAMAEKKHMVFHGNYNDSENLERAVRKLKRAGYRVEIKAIPVHDLVSAVQEQTHAIKLWMPPYSKEQLDSRQKNMADTLAHLQTVKGLVDKIEIVDPLNKSSVSSEYDATRDQWGKERAIVAEIINQLQHRPLSDSEIVALENKIDQAVIGAKLVKSPQSGHAVVALQHLRSDIEQLERNQDAQKERYKHNDQPSPKPPTA